VYLPLYRWLGRMFCGVFLINKFGRRWTACAECNRGGNGNDSDKCSAGWKCTELNGLGCYLGAEIVGDPVKHKKSSRSQ